MESVGAVFRVTI